LSLRLNEYRLSASQTTVGRLFHTTGPATEKALSPNFVLIHKKLSKHYHTLAGVNRRWPHIDWNSHNSGRLSVTVCYCVKTSNTLKKFIHCFIPTSIAGCVVFDQTVCLLVIWSVKERRPNGTITCDLSGAQVSGDLGDVLTIHPKHY